MFEKIIFVFLIACIALPMHRSPAQTKVDVYRQNIVTLLKAGDSSHLIANYWLNIGNDIKAKRALRDLPQELRESVSAIVDRYHYASLRRDRLAEGSVEIENVEKELSRLADEIVDQLFELLGPKLLAKASEEYANDQLSDLVQKEGITGVVNLIDQGMRKDMLLSFGRDKVEEIRNANELLSTELAKVDAEFLERLRDSSKELWRKLLEVLDSVQKLKAIGLLGHQAEWFRFLESPKFLVSERRSFGINYMGRKAEELFSENAMKALNCSDQELEAKGLEVIDPLLLDLTALSFIADELDLSKEQKSELNDLKKNTWSRTGISLSRKQDSRFEQLLKKKAKLPQSLSKILLPNQELWLLQIELQVRIGIQYQSTAGLTHPDVIKCLEINPDQIRKLRDIGENYSKEWNPVLEAYRLKRQKHQTEFVEKVTGIISKREERED